jgi:hypothetical protein
MSRPGQWIEPTPNPAGDHRPKSLATLLPPETWSCNRLHGSKSVRRAHVRPTLRV